MNTTAGIPQEDRLDAQPSNRRTVLLVDDHELVRLGVETLLRDLGPVQCETVHCMSLAEARDICAGGRTFDLVLLDLNLCDSKGLQGLRALRASYPQLPVAVLSATQDEFVVQQAQAMGARGYLLKTWTPEQMRSALCAMLLAPQEGAAAPDRAPRAAGRHSVDRVAELGPRHLEILELLLSGCSNREIATTTNLSVSTVKNYVSAIFLAMDVRSRAHLISLFQ